MALSEYQQKLSRIKNGQEPKTTGPKPRKPIPRQSEKKKREVAEEKAKGGDSEMDLFFQAMRKKMTGRCLFCNGKSQKDNDENFFFSIAHLLPKRDIKQGGFPSVGTNPDNWIELCYYNESCHQNFDSGKITWQFIADSKEFEVIKEKLLNVLPLVAPEERKHKLYSKLNDLVYATK
jgi:hypothetical protein